MSTVALLPVLLAAAFALAGCGGGHELDLAAIRTAAQPSPTERSWRSEVLHLNPEHPPVPARLVAPARQRLERAVTAGSGAVVRLSFLWISGPAPDLVIATADPARYLKHGLPRVVRVLRSVYALYAAVVDRHGGRVLEWSQADNEGSVFVKHGLERCSPVVALGWPSNLPACPSE